MNAEQIINACISGKWTPEHIVLKSGFGVAPLAKHFNLDTSKPTHELKQMIVDCTNESINTSQNG